MQVFHWSRPCNRSYDSMVGGESRGIIEKKAKKNEEVLDRTLQLQTGRDDYTDTM